MEQVLINKTTLTAIGDAIREKESSTELIPVNEMANRISAIAGASGRKTVTGTVTFTTTSNVQNITHNSGFIPTVFAFRIKGELPEEGTTDDVGCVICGTFSQVNGLKWSDYSGWAKFYSSPYNYRRVQIDQVATNDASTGVTETKIRLPRPGNNSYKYFAGYEYEWIAIE